MKPVTFQIGGVPQWIEIRCGTDEPGHPVAPQMNSLQDDGGDLFAAAMERAKARSDSKAMAAPESVAMLPLTDLRRMETVRK